MYSKFTVNLIKEVKKREILYNTNYERRLKSEKDQCWIEIAETLNCKIINFFKILNSNLINHFRYSNGS